MFFASLATKFFRCELRKWPKTTSAGGAHLQLCPIRIRCNVRKKSRLQVYVFLIYRNFLARRSLRVASPRNFARARVYFARPTIAIAKIRDYSQSKPGTSLVRNKLLRNKDAFGCESEVIWFHESESKYVPVPGRGYAPAKIFGGGG